MIQLSIVVKNAHEYIKRNILGLNFTLCASPLYHTKQLEGWFVWYCCVLV